MITIFCIISYPTTVCVNKLSRFLQNAFKLLRRIMEHPVYKPSTNFYGDIIGPSLVYLFQNGY